MQMIDTNDLFNLAANVEAYERARGKTETALPVQADERVRAYDAAIAERLQVGEKQLLQGMSERGASLRFNTQLDLAHDLHRVTRFFLKFFRLGKYYAAAGFDPTVTFCETADEFAEAILQMEHLSEWLKAGEAEKLKAEIQADVRRKGGTRGIHFLGVGSYLNGLLINAMQATPASSPSALLKNRENFPVVLSVAIHEALGHGFFGEFTTTGRELVSIGGETLTVAQTFHLRLADTPRHMLLQYKWSMVNHASLILNEGWATWLAHVLHTTVMGQPRAARYTLTQLWNAVEKLPRSPQARASVRGALCDVFLEPAPTPENLFHAIRVLEGLLRTSAPGMPQAFEYVLGALLFDKLEARVGLANLPLAMLVAANVEYNLPTLSMVELHILLRNTPRFNPNWRLAALTTLTWPTPPAWPTVARAAYDQLNLAIPPELQE